jgi:hypothetical protein
MKRRPLLSPCLEQLEDRAVPAQFGTPWADGTSITLSFVPDGTTIDGSPSVLYQTMLAQGMTPDQWQMEMVRAVANWTNSTNLNVGIVADGGQAIGTVGVIEGDARFGDIRIGARPLSDNVLAITTPPGYIGGTRVGDIILNSTKPFSIGGANNTYDLFSVMLQEAGHAFGVGNSTDQKSPMYEKYLGVRTGLTSGDLDAITDLYGTFRAADALETSDGNETFGRAQEIKYTKSSDASAQRSLVVQADLTSATDLDYYRFRSPKTDNGRGVTVQLTTNGMSTLVPRLYLYAKNQNLIGMVQATNPLQGDMSITLPSGSFALDTDYYIRVDSTPASNPYKIGSYQLRIIFNPDAGDVLTGTVQTLLDDAHNNDAVGNATGLPTAMGYASHTHYRAYATLRDTTDKDFYKIRSANITSNQTQTMTVNVRAADPDSGLAPVVSLYDKDKHLINNVPVLVNGDGTFTLQLANAADDQDYFIGVSAATVNGTTGTGLYYLDVDFHSDFVTLDQLASGTLTNLLRTDYETLEVKRDQALYFLLTAAGGPAGQAAVRMTIHNQAGNVVFVLTAKAGETLSATTMLTQGTYTIRFQGFTRTTGAVLPTLAYSLKSTTLDNPIGPILADPGIDYIWKKDPLAYYLGLTLQEPSGDIVW